MTRRKNNKKALTLSLLSLLLCMAMLVGSTFAWFTDEATTSVNKIESGTLTIELQDKNGNNIEGKSLTFADKNGKTDILFEPGATFLTNAFKIVNTGNLEAKYKIEINGLNGDAELLEVITFSLLLEDGTEVAMEGNTYTDFEGEYQITFDEDGKAVITTTSLPASDLMQIKAHMSEDAGNEYQGLTLEGIGITVLATQDTVEFDSYSDQYDANADFADNNDAGNDTIVNDDDTLTAAIEANVPYTVVEANYSKTVVADAVAVTIDGGTFSSQIVAARNGGTVTINNATAGSETGGPAILANVNGNATVIINGGSYIGNTVFTGDGTGTAEITGGYFDCGTLYYPQTGKPVANLTITGGTFSSTMCLMQGLVGLNLSDFVPDTHQVVNNTDGSCTVVAK